MKSTTILILGIVLGGGVLALPLDKPSVDTPTPAYDQKHPSDTFPDLYLTPNEFTPMHLANRESVNSSSNTTGSVPINSNVTTTPSNCTLESCLTGANSIRDKQRRLEEIKFNILSSLFPDNQVAPTGSSGSMSPPTGFSPPPPTPQNVGKIQLFYSTCDFPSRSDESTWRDPKLFHIFFNLSSAFPHPTPSSPTSTVPSIQNSVKTPENRSESSVRGFPGIPINLVRSPSKYKDLRIRATLKLYKIGSGKNAEEIKYESPNPSKPCTEKQDVVEESESSFPRNSADEDERVRISVFWYTQHLTSHHYKRKLLDSKFFLAKESKWIEFDISKASRAWIERNNNNGLIIEVENENEELVDARQYIADLPCQAILNINETANRSERVLPPPMLEVCTIERAPSGGDDDGGYPIPFEYPTANDFMNGGKADENPFKFPFSRSQKHPHRHGHGSLRKNQRHRRRHQTLGESNEGGFEEFKLDENHPLRSILMGNSFPHPPQQAHTQSDSPSRVPAPSSLSSDLKTTHLDLEAFKSLIREVNNQNKNQLNMDSGEEGIRPIIIQRIIINPESLKAPSTPSTPLRSPIDTSS